MSTKAGSCSVAGQAAAHMYAALVRSRKAADVLDAGRALREFPSCLKRGQVEKAHSLIGSALQAPNLRVGLLEKLNNAAREIEAVAPGIREQNRLAEIGRLLEKGELLIAAGKTSRAKTLLNQAGRVALRVEQSNPTEGIRFKDRIQVLWAERAHAVDRLKRERGTRARAELATLGRRPRSSH